MSPQKFNFLDFEQPIAELESKIEELRFVQDDSAVDISAEIEKLAKKSQTLTKDIYAKLSAWQISQVARHPQRPYTLDYINMMMTDFEELHGDRSFGEDPALVGGLARFNGQTVMVMGQQKGRDTKERQFRNFGMPRPEGYRKALRLMKLAEKFGVPIVSLIDTPGAYPGEGGSGGALAIAVGDVTYMLQYATYSVITPEGCAAILWKDSGRASEAAEALGITAPKLKALGLVDKILNEPLGGAHRDPQAMAVTLKKAIADSLKTLSEKTPDKIVQERQKKLLELGKFKELVE